MQQSTRTDDNIHPHQCIPAMLCSGLYVMSAMLELGLLFENVVRGQAGRQAGRQAAAGDA